MRVTAHVVGFALLLVSGSAAAQGYSQGAAPTAYVPLAAGEGATLAVDADSSMFPINLPFSFALYGKEYTKAWVSVNGALVFEAVDPISGQPVVLPDTNTTLPRSARPHGIIAVAWDDWVASAGAPGGSRIAWTSSGEPPDRHVVVDWQRMQRSGATGGSAPTYSFSVEFREQGAIELRYGTPTQVPPASAVNATVGVENANGTSAMDVGGCGATCTFPSVGRSLVPFAAADLSVSVLVEGSESGPVVRATVRNTGNTAASTSLLLLSSTDAVRDDADVVIGTLDVSVSSQGTAALSTPLALPEGTTGTRYVLAVVDPENTTPELNEANNNAASEALAVGLDLTVSGTGQASAVAGEEATFRLNLRNRGTANASGIGLRIVAAGNGLVTPLELWRSAPIALRGLEQRYELVKVAIPATLPAGDYTLRAQIDFESALAELDEANNQSATMPLAVRGTDIAVVSVQPALSRIAFGGILPVRFTLRNAGPVRASGFVARVCLSDNEALTLSDPCVDATEPLTLEGLETRSFSRLVTVPANLAPGAWYVGVIADAERVIVETNRRNNAGTSQSTILLGPPVPDLAVLAVSAPSRGAPGETLLVSGDVLNDGAADTGTDYAFVLSPNESLSLADLVLARGRVTIQAGAWASLRFSATLPATLAPGSYHVGLLVDGAGLVPEGDETNNAAIAPEPVVVGAASLRVTTPSLPDPIVGLAYGVQLAAIGAAGPVSWELAGGAFPTGLSVSPTGLISGVPEQAGRSVIVVRAKSGGVEALATFLLNVVASAPSLGVVDLRLPTGRVGVAYEQRIGAIGGTPPYRFTLAQGRLPSGLALAEDGTVAGIPNVAEPQTFRVVLEDMGGHRVEAPLALEVLVDGGLRLSSVRPADARTSQPYSTQLLAEGGTAPYTVRVVEGALPPGLVVTPPTVGSTIVISGTPTEPGSWPFTLEVRDAKGGRDLAPLVIHVGSGSLVIVTAELPDANRGRPYEATLDSNAAPPATWSLVAGTLPPGLTLGADGALSGTVTGDASYGLHPFAARVVDASGSNAIAPFVIDLPAPPLPVESGGCATAGPGVLAAAVLAFLLRRRRAGLAAAAMLLALPLTAHASYRLVRRGEPFTLLTGGTTVLDAVRDGATPLPAELVLPFPFKFYRQSFSTIGVSARGLLTFGVRDPSAANVQIPNPAGPSNFVAPWWDDLQLGGGTPGGVARISWTVEGTAPDRAFVVEWKDMQSRAIGQSGPSIASYSFQVRLHETTGAITIHYGGAPIVMNPPAYMTATVGIEGPGGTVGVESSDTGCTPFCSGTDFPFDAVVRLEPLPDLVVGSVLLPDPVRFDTDTDVTAQIRNDGAGDASGVKVAFDLVASGGTRARLVTSEPVSIAAGDAALVSVRLRVAAHDPARVPVDLPPGVQRLVVIADPADAITEFDEANDESDIQLLRLVGNGPDLQVPRLLGPTSGSVGQPFQIARTIRNAGQAQARGTASYRLSTNDLVTSADRLVFSEPFDLARDGALAGSVDLAVPADVPPGRYWLGLEANAEGEVYPSDDARVLGPIELRGGGLAVATETLPDVPAGAPFAVQLKATGGSGDERWSIDGTVPAGVGVTAEGLLGGLVDEVSEQPLRVRVQSGAVSASRLLTLRTTGRTSALAVASARLPIGIAGGTYAARLVAFGGEPPYSWSLGDDAVLPLGLQLGASGDLEGTPLVDGDATFAVTVTDAAGATASGTVELSVAGAVRPMFATGELPAAFRGASYEALLVGTGGTPPYRFSVLDTRRVPSALGDAGEVLSGAVPSGLELSEDGRLTGTPTTTGVYLVTVRLVDAAARDDMATLALAVEDGVDARFEIATSSLPDAVAGQRYAVALLAQGANGSVTWSLAPAGTTPLPETLSLRPGGTLSFFPSSAGTVAFLVMARDDAGRVALRALALRVREPAAEPEAGCASTGVAGLAALGLLALFVRRRGVRAALLAAAVTVSGAACTEAEGPCGESCPTGLSCDPTDGLCKCGGAGGAVCRGGETCDGTTRTCLAPTCATSCPAGTACGADGACHCGGVLGPACDAGDVCGAFGRCESVDPCAGVSCSGGMVCDASHGGECRCGTGGPACGAGEQCVGGECRRERCSGVACTGGAECDPADGLCKCGGAGGGVCRAGEACGADRRCVRSSRCDGVTCRAGEVCDPTDGKCTCGRLGGPYCRDDQTCEPLAAVCKGGELCATVTCTSGLSCDPEDGSCRCGGFGGQLCGATEACVGVASGRRCAKSCTVLGTSSCESGSTCRYDVDARLEVCGHEGTGRDGDSCDEVASCGPGLHCSRPRADLSGACRKYCRSPADCGAGSACSPFTTGATLGVCVTL